MKIVRRLIGSELPFFFMLPALIWQILFLVIPFGVMLTLSIISQDGSLTLTHYYQVFDLPHFRVILRSIVIAAGTAVTCLLCAYPISYFLVLYVKKWRNFLLFLLTLPFWTNILLLVYSWFFLLERHGIVNSLLLKFHIISEPLHLAHNMYAVFVVMVYCYLPFMIMPLYSVMEKMNTRLLDASFDLGGTRWQTFKFITLPLSFSGIVTGLCLVFVPAFGEFAIPTLIGGSKSMMVGYLIYYYLLVARENGLAGAFTVVAGLTVIIMALCIYGVFISITRMIGRRRQV